MTYIPNDNFFLRKRCKIKMLLQHCEHKAFRFTDHDDCTMSNQTILKNLFPSNIKSKHFRKFFQFRLIRTKNRGSTIKKHMLTQTLRHYHNSLQSKFMLKKIYFYVSFFFCRQQDKSMEFSWQQDKFEINQLI